MAHESLVRHFGMGQKTTAEPMLEAENTECVNSKGPVELRWRLACGLHSTRF